MLHKKVVNIQPYLNKTSVFTALSIEQSWKQFCQMMEIFWCFMIDLDETFQFARANNKNLVKCRLRAYMDLVGLLKILNKY